MTFLAKTFFKLNLICHSSKQFDYAVGEPHLLPAATRLHKHVCLSGFESWASLHKLVYACVCVCVWAGVSAAQRARWNLEGCCEDVCAAVSMNECGVRKSVNKAEQIDFDGSPSVSSSPESLSLCVFVVGKFIWVSVKLIVKHGHNGPILLWHIQQWGRHTQTRTMMTEQTYTHVRFTFQHCLMLC